MTLLYILVFLVVVFVLLWNFAPSGWMTNIKTTLLGALAGLPPIIDQLADDIRWGDILDPKSAAIVAAVLVVMGILARMRSKIRGK